jgi:L-ascorbate metabolism protein UlaG (beta-lactamase superfamily)
MRSLALVAGLVLVAAAAHAQGLEKDVIPTSAGEVAVTFVGHGTLVLGYGGKTIHVDPFGRLADYATLPKADLVLVTHSHGDHLDPAALAAIRRPDTQVVVAPDCEGKVEGAVVLQNGERKAFAGIEVAAVPPTTSSRSAPTERPSPEGLATARAHLRRHAGHVAGDTENVPEMKALEGIAVAFLPMNLPYTMTPEMVADAARAFRPRILYPYHFGDTDTARLVALLKDEKGLEVRLRRMK